MEIPTYEEIKPYIEKKLVSEQVHPEAPNLHIFNYTQACQFSQSWDDVTRQCRGLIMDIVKVYDDRPSVIRMWREKGLEVEDVGAGVEF